jgi:hypothetical protein
MCSANRKLDPRVKIMFPRLGGQCSINTEKYRNVMPTTKMFAARDKGLIYLVSGPRPKLKKTVLLVPAIHQSTFPPRIGCTYTVYLGLNYVQVLVYVLNFMLFYCLIYYKFLIRQHSLYLNAVVTIFFKWK